MANVFVTPKLIASTGIATLYNQLVFTALVWRDFDPDFTGKQGATVSIRKPSVFEAVDFDMNERKTEYQDAGEDLVDITLDHLTHVPFHVEDEQTTLEIEDFEEQLLDPAMEAIAQKMDAVVAQTVLDAAQSVGQVADIADSPDGKANYVFRRARAKLGRRKFPQAQRVAVVSPEGAVPVLGDPLIIEADKSGWTEALREGVMGKLLGFNTFESQALGAGPGNLGDADGVAFHRTAVALATRQLAKPRGLASEQVALTDYKGLSLRVTYAYDQAAKKDLVDVDILYGTLDTRPEGAVELDLGEEPVGS